jgi:tetratricopeptide (TPR) repeat protein
MAHWGLGLLHTVRGHLGRALAVGQSGLRIASKLGHRGWEVANRFTLGVSYGELLTPEEALPQLEEALSLASELRSQYWVHHITGALAGAYTLLDDLSAAQTRLEMVLSPQTPMDTIGKRYCWARRAELALAQGDLGLTLDITDRLIASAPGMSPGRVITFLWKLKGEALAATGRTEEACSLLHAAIENARATEERFLLWCIHASLGRLYRATDCQREAEEEFSAASELIETLGATIPDETLKDNFLRGAYSTFRSLP